MLTARRTKIEKNAFSLELLDNPLSRKEDFERLPSDILNNMQKLQELRICKSIKEKTKTAEAHLEQLRLEIKNATTNARNQSLQEAEQINNNIDKPIEHQKTPPGNTPKNTNGLVYMILAALLVIVLLLKFVFRKK